MFQLMTQRRKGIDYRMNGEYFHCGEEMGAVFG
jgi:hypothetical protein